MHASQDALCMAGQHVVEMVAVVNHSKEQTVFETWGQTF